MWTLISFSRLRTENVGLTDILVICTVPYLIIFLIKSWEIVITDSCAHWRLMPNRNRWRRSRACQSCKIFSKAIWNCFMVCPVVKVSVEGAVESTVSRFESHFDKNLDICIILKTSRQSSDGSLNACKYPKNWIDKIVLMSFLWEKCFAHDLWAHQSTTFCQHDAFNFGRKQASICLGYEEAKKNKAPW